MKSGLLQVFARREPTTDDVVRKYASAVAATAQDVQVYKDEACTVPFCRFRWDSASRPTRRNKRVTINCWVWGLVWLPALG